VYYKKKIKPNIYNRDRDRDIIRNVSLL